jgi:PAS domain-containing protein
MISNSTLKVDIGGAEDQPHGLSERVAQLEQENALLEEVLHRNTRMFEALLSNGSDGITLTGPDRRIVRIIKGLTDIDPNLLIGRLVDTAAFPEDRQIIADAYQQLLVGHCGQIKIEFRLVRADGTIAGFRATLTDMLDDPNVHGIVWNYSALPSCEPDPLKTLFA